MIVLIAALLLLLALRVAAAAGEAAIANAPAARRRGVVNDEILAAAARATAHVAGATVVGLVTTLVWLRAGRGAVPLVLAIVVPAILVLADLVPRGMATETPEHRRRRLEWVLVGAAGLLSPLLVVERGLWRLGRQGAPPALAALRRLGGWLTARPRQGPLEVSEAGLVARIARFASRTAGDAMVPHVDVCAVPDTATVGDVVTLVQQRGYSRLPVFHERMFNALGIVASLDLLGVVDPHLPVTAVMREPLFVPESKPLDELLATLQHEGRNLALVVDEYGGMVGLVTVEDLIEEIVGQIEDEYDPPRELYRRIAPGVFVVSARAPVTEVNERFGWNLPQGEYETLGGLVLERLGRVPKSGDGLRAGRVHIDVTRATSRAVLELRVEEAQARARRGR
jgi:CBS domain containing-hemolysin-like protein